MENIARDINDNEVISITNKEDNILIDHHTYKAGDFVQKLKDNIHYSKSGKWLEEGVPCEILSPNHNWQNGKIKICVQFIPDRPESPLDGIRQENQ